MTLFEQLRAADPLDPAELASWSGTLPDLPTTVVVQRRRRMLPLAVAVLVAGGAGAAIATEVLGGPAPDSIKAHLAQLDYGIPADLRYNADVEHARTVAATDNGALYLADRHDGGYCLEIGSPPARPRGASCPTTERPLEVLAPIPDDDQSPLLVGGRANDDRIARVQVLYPSGRTAAVAFGLDRAWLLEVPVAEQSAVLAKGLVIMGLSRAGTPVTTVQVPALRDDDPLGTAHDKDQALVLTTTSDGEDLTLVLGIQGRVNLSGVRLEVRFPDGTPLAVPVASDGTYSVTFPPERRDDFASAPGELVAIRDGNVVASRPIGSVAWWRGHTS